MCSQTHPTRKSPSSKPECQRASGDSRGSKGHPWLLWCYYGGATTQSPGGERRGSLPGDGPHLHVLAEEERAHVRRGRCGVWFQQLAGGHGLLVALLALPVLQQGLEHVQAVVHSPGAQQGSGRGARDEGRRLRRSREKVRMAGRPECSPAEPESRNALTTL